MDKGATSMQRGVPVPANAKPSTVTVSRPRIDPEATPSNGGSVDSGDNLEIIAQMACIRTELEKLSARQTTQMQAMTDGFDALKEVLDKLVKASRL